MLRASGEHVGGSSDTKSTHMADARGYSALVFLIKDEACLRGVSS